MVLAVSYLRPSSFICGSIACFRLKPRAGISGAGSGDTAGPEAGAPAGVSRCARFWANYLLRSGVAGLSCEHGLAAGCFAFDRRRYCGTFSLGAVSQAQIQPGTGHSLRLCVCGWTGLEKLNRFPRAQGRASANYRQIPVTLVSPHDTEGT